MKKQSESVEKIVKEANKWLKDTKMGIKDFRGISDPYEQWTIEVIENLLKAISQAKEQGKQEERERWIERLKKRELLEANQLSQKEK